MGSGGQQKGGAEGVEAEGVGVGVWTARDGLMDARAWGRPSFERGQGFGGGNPPVRGALFSG